MPSTGCSRRGTESLESLDVLPLVAVGRVLLMAMEAVMRILESLNSDGLEALWKNINESSPPRVTRYSLRHSLDSMRVTTLIRPHYS